jgi:putative hydrolase of the HAD superfamily
LLDLLTRPVPALRDHPEFAADVFPKLFDQVWHDFTRAEAWEVFPETEPVIKVHVHMSQAERMRIVRLTSLMLQTLRSNGIKVAVVSNFDERLVLLPALGTTKDSSSTPFIQPLLLKNLGLDHLFDVVLPSCYAGVAKPDPDIFYQALRKANVEGSEAVHVGDDYKKDYRGAKVRHQIYHSFLNLSLRLSFHWTRT